MPTIQFDDQVNTVARRKVQGSGMTGFLIKTGVVRSPQGANLLLIAFIVIGMITSIFLLYRSLGPAPIPDNPPVLNDVRS